MQGWQCVVVGGCGVFSVTLAEQNSPCPAAAAAARRQLPGFGSFMLLAAVVPLRPAAAAE